MEKQAKNTVFLWYDGDAEEAGFVQPIQGLDTAVAINPGVRSRYSRPRALELNAVGVWSAYDPQVSFISYRLAAFRETQVPPV